MRDIIFLHTYIEGGVIMHYYQRLRDLREDHDKSQADIAAILGISRQHYSLYERGERELPMHHFMKLAKLYNVSLDYLSGLSTNPDTLDRKQYNPKTKKT